MAELLPVAAEPLVNVVILSLVNDQKFHRVTQTAVDSCLKGSDGLPITVTVIENGTQDYPGKQDYTGAVTVRKPETFNFNGFANHGASLGTAEWIMIANNDVIFHEGWLPPLLAADHDVMSPQDPTNGRQNNITGNIVGDVNGRHFGGGCFMIRRVLWERIGGFDTCVAFWCSDDVVIEQVKAAGVLPMMVFGSHVEQLPSLTLRAQTTAVQDEWRWRNVHIFNTKYGKQKFAGNPQHQAWLKRNRLDK